MNWEAIGAVGEVTGAIAVVITVVYLAVQLRRNTNALKSSTERDISSALSNMAMNISHTEIPDIMLRASEGLQQLDKKEIAQFAYYLNGVLRHFEYAYSQHRLGNLSDDSWQAINQTIKQNFSSVGVQKYWIQRSTSFRLDFQDYISGLDPASFPAPSESVLEKLQSETK